MLWNKNLSELNVMLNGTSLGIFSFVNHISYGSRHINLKKRYTESKSVHLCILAETPFMRSSCRFVIEGTILWKPHLMVQIWSQSVSFHISYPLLFDGLWHEHSYPIFAIRCCTMLPQTVGRIKFCVIEEK